MPEQKLKFKVTLEGQEGSSVAGFSAPFNVMETFGTRARVPVRGTINGFPFRSSLMPMGGCHRMVVNRTLRAGANCKAGDTVNIVLQRDTEERSVDVPPDLARVLTNHKKAKEHWDKLAFTHKKEMAKWILEAKQEETKKRRLEKILQVLKTGTKWTG